MGKAGPDSGVGKDHLAGSSPSLPAPIRVKSIASALVLSLPGCILVTVDPALDTKNNSHPDPTGQSHTEPVVKDLDAGGMTSPRSFPEAGSDADRSTRQESNESGVEAGSAFAQSPSPTATTSHPTGSLSCEAMGAGACDSTDPSPTADAPNLSSGGDDDGGASTRSCDAHDTLRCADDGNVHWFDSCGQQEELIDECPGACIDDANGVRCRCVIRVGRGGPSADQDGSTWRRSFAQLADGLAAAKQNGDCEVWVSGAKLIDGTVMEEGVDMYGGFDEDADMQLRTQRDPAAHVTTLTAPSTRSSDVGGLVGANNATIDGFTLIGIRTYGALVNNGTSPTVRNCIFQENGVGTITNINGAAPVIENCTFIDNHGTEFGNGAIHNEESSPVFRNCLFQQNHYALSEVASHSRFEDSSFSENYRIHFDGATIVDSKFANNVHAEDTPIVGKNVYIVGSWFEANRGLALESLDFSGVVVNSVFTRHAADAPIVGMGAAGSVFSNNVFFDNEPVSPPPAGGQPSKISVAAGDGTIVTNTIFADPRLLPNDPNLSGEVSHCLFQVGPSSCETCLYGDPVFEAIQGSAVLRPTNDRLFDAGSRSMLPRDRADLDRDGDVEEVIPLDALGGPRIVGNEVDIGPVEVE